MTARWLCLAVALCAALPAAAAEMLFDKGRTDWKICLSPQSGPTETYAAQELRGALRRISGVDFEVVSTANPPDVHAIIIGDLKDPAVQAQAAALKLTPGKVEQVAVRTLGGRLYLAGNQPRGALYAVYSFLQRDLGVRWLWPGPDGEFILARERWALPELSYNHTPAYPYRGFHLCGDYYRAPDAEVFREWMARNFINIYRHAAPLAEKRRGFYSMWSSHNVFLPKEVFDRHPEYFAEVGGKRYADNICFSSPEVDKLIAGSTAEYVRKHPQLDILSLFPRDTTTYCRCAKCSTMDPSTAWFEFFNRLTDTLKKEFPALRFGATAYFEYRTAPKCQIRNAEFVEYCSYTRCNVHPYGWPDCKRNEETIREMHAWQATGLAIGNYSYEFDVFKKNHRFTPFLSVIDDAVKTGRKLGHVTLVPEVLLIAQKYVAAEEYVFNVQQRLPIYLYARLLWEPDRAMTDVVDDWCRTAFGEAAEPMRGYYLGMDRAWSAMPTHSGILGNALNVASLLLTDKVREEAAAAFTAAEDRMAKIADPAARARAAAVVHRERVLFKQWEDLVRESRTDAVRLNLPLLAQREDFAQSACRPQPFGAPPVDAEVSMAWTREALLVKWTCRDPGIGALKTNAVRDGNVAGDDSVEMALASGLTGETWHFAVNARGTTLDYRDTGVGVRDDRWDPVWQATTKIGAELWRAEMSIPFASLGQAPNPNENWQARFTRHNGGRAEIAESAFPAGEMALLQFSSKPQTDRQVLWWSGAPDREAKGDAALTQEFTQAGWEISIVTTGEKLSAVHDRCSAFWFRHPDGPNKVPADYWERSLAPAVRNGAVAVFVSYLGIPLDRYFKDPSMTVRSVGLGKDVPLAARVSAFIAPGDWSAKPNDLLGRLKNRITPAYGFIPADAKAWTVLATAPQGAAQTMPYILIRPYGKGMIVLCGDSIALSPAAMLDNFVVYNESSRTPVQGK